MLVRGTVGDEKQTKMWNKKFPLPLRHKRTRNDGFGRPEEKTGDSKHIKTSKKMGNNYLGLYQGLSI